MAESPVNSLQTAVQQGPGNEPLPDGLKSSITAMMTAMMSTFKDELLREFEDYFSSTELEGGQETIFMEMPKRQKSSNVTSIADTNLTTEPNDSSVSIPLLILQQNSPLKTRLDR